MELRKIQMTGGSSFTVTLPKDWVGAAGLDAGDAVGMQPQDDGSLVLHPHARLARVATRYDLDIGEDPEAAFRGIVAAYLSGYDVVRVKSRRALTPAVRRAVRSATRRIIGLEVVEEEPTHMTLQDFLDPREFHIDKGLRRMQALCRTMQDDAVAAFHQRIEDFEAAFSERDDEVDRLYWMINKQYHAILRDPTYAARMGVNASQALNHLLVARVIERTADHARRVAENVQAMHGDDIRQKLETKIEKHARNAVALFGDAMTAFHKRDATAANHIIDQSRAFRSLQDPLLRESLSLAGESILHVAYALESIGRTAAYAADVAEVAINHEVAMRA